jgi:hypothetical protein
MSDEKITSVRRLLKALERNDPYDNIIKGMLSHLDCLEKEINKLEERVYLYLERR